MVTGVSGSGKSTLVEDILYQALARHLYGSHTEPGPYKTIEGLEHIDKVIEIDQSPSEGRRVPIQPLILVYLHRFENCIR